MKLFLVFFGAAAIIIMRVSAEIVPDCRTKKCEKWKCPVLGYCPCGTYKDYCGCCRYCSLCPWSACTVSYLNTCQKGYKCVADSHRYGILPPGHCRPAAKSIYPLEAGGTDYAI
ncbi:single insulin-like growth factor-binding domain protein-1 [Haemaphysalis longicornis]